MNIAPLKSGICFRAATWKSLLAKPDPHGINTKHAVSVSVRLKQLHIWLEEVWLFPFLRWQDVQDSIMEKQLFCNEKLHTLIMAAIMEMVAGNFACLIACFSLAIKINLYNFVLLQLTQSTMKRKTGYFTK